MVVQLIYIGISSLQNLTVTAVWYIVDTDKLAKIPWVKWYFQLCSGSANQELTILNLVNKLILYHDRKLNRLPGFDYTREALYFVTACVKNGICVFGEISNKTMLLNVYGRIAEQQLIWLEQQYRFLRLHEFVIMPNHMHAIIEINHFSKADQFLKIKSLSEIVGAYKTTTSKQIHLAGLKEFKWHRSFYDHIIRNQESYFKISNYIINNPSNWKGDKFHFG